MPLRGPERESMPTAKQIDAAYKLARERYEALGVNADKACMALPKIPVSLHCWQGDDVGGFENQGGAVGGGLAVTGNYPGRARTPDELRGDLDQRQGELANSLTDLRREIVSIADWRAQINRTRGKVLAGAAVAGFVLGGGIAAVIGRRRR